MNILKNHGTTYGLTINESRQGQAFVYALKVGIKPAQAWKTVYKK